MTRLEWQTGSSYPGSAALGAVDDVELTEAVAASIARRARRSRRQLEPRAGRRRERAREPGDRRRARSARMRRLSRAMSPRSSAAAGARRRGVREALPGHGATEQDSHLELPVVDGDVEAGARAVPRRDRGRCRTIMTAHVLVPALDDAPATLSAAIVNGLLRDELGFDGVVLADALEMKAVSETVGIEESAVRALNAGVDALCVGHDLGETAVERILAALADRVPEERLHEAAGRIDALATWARPIAGGVDHAAGRDAARRALRIEGDLSFAAAPVVVELRPRANIAAGEAEHSLAAASSCARASLFPPPDVFVVRDAHRHPWMRQAADAPGVVVVETGLPVWQPARSRGYIATNGGSRASLDAARELLAPG